jgi:hypothetical protein
VEKKLKCPCSNSKGVKDPSLDKIIHRIRVQIIIAGMKYEALIKYNDLREQNLQLEATKPVL